jgi:hypothetical protein
MTHPHDDRLPYGLFELHPTLITDPGPPFRVRCCVKDCDRILSDEAPFPAAAFVDRI